MSDLREDERRTAFIEDHGRADWVELERDARRYHWEVEEFESPQPKREVVVYDRVTSVMLRP